MGRALITSASTRVAYCICKSLSRRGIKAVMADSDPLAMSFWSRHASRRRRYTSPFRDEEAFIEDILRIIREERIDVLIPVLEETYFVARHQTRMEPHVRMFQAPYKNLIALHDKHSLSERAARLGVRMPKTLALSEVLAVGTPEGFRFPAVLKPKQGGGGWSVMEIDSRVGLTTAVKEHALMPERYLLQERIDGSIVGVAMLFREGCLVAEDSYQTLQTYPHPYGQPTIRCSREFKEALAGLRRILEDVRFTGPCQADFLHLEDRNESYLIDVNPRFWGSVGQSIARCIDFPYYYYKCALGEYDFQVPKSPPAVATKWLGGDLMRKVTGLMSGKTVTRPHNSQTQIPSSPASMDDFEIGDPFPFLGWCVDQTFRKARSIAGISDRREALDGIWK